MSILNILSIGTTALLTSKKAMETTAHNIANASTTGYTRQSVELSSIASGLNTTVGESGRGVTISDVTRLYDSFTTLQLRTEKSNAAYWDTYSDISSEIESVFNETSDSGISTAISDFFNSWKSVADNAQGTTERTTLLSNAEYLASRIGSAYDTLANQRTDIYKSSQDQVDEVNSITKQISQLNDKILQSPGALDLKDQRDQLVEQLNEIVSVNTVTDNDGRYNIYLGGSALVSASGAATMSVSLDSSNNMEFEITQGSSTTNINDEISGGKLQANLDARDTTIVDYMNSLNAFAINLSDQVNYNNRQGYGLDGTTGNDFFTSLVDITDSSASGTASSVTVSDVSAYGAGINNQYRITYNTTGGAGYQQEGTSGLYFMVEQTADSGTTWTTVPTTDVTLSYDTSATDPGSRTLSFGGLTAQVDGAESALLSDAGGGTFVIEPDRSAATNMSVAITDGDKIAAASDATLLPGDNTNAEIIADLVDQNIIAGKTPVTFYSDIVSLSGANADTANTYVDFETSMVSQLETKRSETSGVSLDEEAVYLIQYQKAFEAASKLITIGSEMLDTLIKMV
jgi:flagellar hook-associated protein 1